MNHKLSTIIGLLGIICIASLWQSDNASAYTPPSVEVAIGTQETTGKLIGNTEYDTSENIYIPVQIKLQNIRDYTISFYAKDGVLKGEKGASIPSLPSLETATITSDNLINHWGYRFALDQNATTAKSATKNKIFSPVPSTTQRIASKDVSDPNGNETVHLGLDFGARTDGNIAADTYTGKIFINVTASPKTVTLFELTYMQEMTHEICNQTITPSNTAIYPTDASGNLAFGDATHANDNTYIPLVGLIDSRDFKSYLVAKLADGNCWMIQNLALDSGDTEETRRVITSRDSNLEDNTSYKLPKSEMNFTYSGNSYRGLEMYNGTHVDNKTDNYTVSNDDPIHGYGDGSGDNTGAYYSWTTANARPDTSTPAGDMLSSICPKGWQLPSASKNEGEGQIYELVNAYDADWNKFEPAWRPGYAGSINNATNINNGISTIWWSRTSVGYGLMFTVRWNNDPDRLTPSKIAGNGTSTMDGRSVRCVAK